MKNFRLALTPWKFSGWYKGPCPWMNVFRDMLDFVTNSSFNIKYNAICKHGYVVYCKKGALRR